MSQSRQISMPSFPASSSTAFLPRAYHCAPSWVPHELDPKYASVSMWSELRHESRTGAAEWQITLAMPGGASTACRAGRTTSCHTHAVPNGTEVGTRTTTALPETSAPTPNRELVAAALAGGLTPDRKST